MRRADVWPGCFSVVTTGTLQGEHGASSTVRFLAQRIENLGVLEWDVWADQGESLQDGLDPRPRAAEMLRAAPGKGECLMAGTFAPAPAFVQVRSRRTREGGSDVVVPHRPN